MSDVHLYSITAEQCVLGALMLDARAIARVSDWLAETDFSREDHRAIYRVLVELAAAGKPVDQVTVGEYVDACGLADSVGGLEYLWQLSSNTPSAANVASYAEIVLEKSRLRQARDIGAWLSDAAAQGKAAADVVAMAAQRLAALQCEAARGGLQPLKPAAREFFNELRQRYESGEKMSGRLTPWHDVNELTLGLKPADLIIVAGRPGMGKSVAGFGLATFDAMRGGRPAVFSLEMSAAQFVEREVAAIGEIPHEWLRGPSSGPAADEYWPRVTTAIEKLVGSNLLIDDTAGLTIEQIAARARRAHLQAPLTMVVIDHLHIVKVKGGEGLVHQLGDVSRTAKRLAKELRCPVVLLAQLNRGNEQRTDKRPTMADLRGSGEIEQDADYILLLHRDGYYDVDGHGDSDRRRLVEMIVGKARHAKRQVVNLKDSLDQMRFDDWIGPVPTVVARTSTRGFQ